MMNNEENFGREPDDPTPIGLVTNNFVMDQELIKINKQNIVDQTAYYTGNTHEDNFSVYPHELCWSFSDNTKFSRIPTDYRPKILSNFLGMQEITPDKTHLVKFAGVGLGSGGTYDERGQNTKYDLALQLGGLCKIRNNSKDKIKQGDWIYWEIPKAHEITKNTLRKPGFRYLLLTKVYHPKEHDISVEKIIHYMTSQEGQNFINDILTENVDENQSMEETQLFVYSLFKLKDLDSKDLSIDSQKKEVSEHLSNLLSAIEYYNNKIKTRIIGKAMTSAEPGNYFEIQLGRYCV